MIIEFQYLFIFQTKFQQSQSYLLPQHSTLQNQQNPDRAAIFGGPKTTQNQDYSRFVFNFNFFFDCVIENPDSYLLMLCTILFFPIKVFRSECFLRFSNSNCFLLFWILEDSYYKFLKVESYDCRILEKLIRNPKGGFFSESAFWKKNL